MAFLYLICELIRSILTILFSLGTIAAAIYAIGKIIDMASALVDDSHP